MSEVVVGVQLQEYGAPLFCRAAPAELRAGMRVLVERADGVAEGVVTIEPVRIIAASLPDDAPRVTAILPSNDVDPTPVVPEGVIVLAADDGEVKPDDVARALRLAALPLPAVPERR